MSRSGYGDYESDGNWDMIRWSGALKKALYGRPGQAFLRELLAALDAMPAKRLIAHDLEREGEVCALGALGRARGLDMAEIDPEAYEQVAEAFACTETLAREVEFWNDEALGYRKQETPEERWVRMRAWVAKKLEGGVPKPEELSEAGKQALALYLEELRDEWVSRYGADSMAKHAEHLVPLWISQTLDLFTEDELIELALGDEGDFTDPEEWPEGVPRAEED